MLVHVPMCWCSSSSPWSRGPAALRERSQRGRTGRSTGTGSDLSELTWPRLCLGLAVLLTSTLTYRAIQGQTGLQPKALHLSPEGLPHVSKICCGLWGRDEDWSESDSSLMLLANGPCLPAIACTLVVRPGRRWQRQEAWAVRKWECKASRSPSSSYRGILTVNLPLGKYYPNSAQTLQEQTPLGKKTPWFYQVWISNSRLGRGLHHQANADFIITWDLINQSKRSSCKSMPRVVTRWCNC